MNQLSFGVSADFFQSELDETEFLQSGDFDPIINGTIVQKDAYFNLDIGASYNYLDFYLHGTIKNAIETRREIYTEFESDNLRKYLLRNLKNLFNKKYCFLPLLFFNALSKKTF